MNRTLDIAAPTLAAKVLLAIGAVAWLGVGGTAALYGLGRITGLVPSRPAVVLPDVAHRLDILTPDGRIVTTYVDRQAEEWRPCRAIVQTGTHRGGQCNNRARPGSAFCGVHKDRQPSYPNPQFPVNLRCN